MTQPYIHNGLHIDRVSSASGRTELRLCPAALTGTRVPRRDSITGRPECRATNPRSRNPDNMVQLKLKSDRGTGGFTGGITMQDSPSVDNLEFQETTHIDESHTVSRFEDKRHGLIVEQHLESTPVEGTLRAWTTVTNHGQSPVTLEYLTSFVLSNITPFAVDDAPGRLQVHRFRSWWSNEGRLTSESLEQLHLERSWAGSNLVSERFGQVGSMPVRKFFPFVAVEDTEAGVVWGAQLAWAGSWQMEITRRADSVSISGGLADYEFGHWQKSLAPNESLTTPVVHLACVQGTLDNLTDKLVKLQESLLPEAPATEADLPVIFNEWCTNWGSPSHDKTIALAKRLIGTGIRYIVIDDGWALRPPEATMQSNGDWIVDSEKFPKGMRAVCQELREMGFTPGVWFEFEICNPGSKAFEQTAHHLHCEGQALLNGSRRFWNLNDPWVQDYLGEKLIDFLSENGFGYLKVDYNDSIGIGSDHADSLGEGLRQQVNGIHATFDRIRNSLPDLVIENCSSGGHRLEPSMMQRTAMSSFSDAHESWNIPIIARQLHHLMPPRQSQIWAVLYPDDSPERFMYSLTATLYGRMCLSGPVHDLSDAQMETVKEAVAFYQEAAPIIKSGRTRFIGATPDSWNHPSGWSGIWRENDNSHQVLLVIHTFVNLADEDLRIELPSNHDWQAVRSLHDATTRDPEVTNGSLILSKGSSFRGYAFLFNK